MAVQVTLSDLRAKVDQGWKKDALAEHYGLPKSQVATLLKQAGLTIRKFHIPKFELVDDTNHEVLTIEDINDTVENTVEDISNIEVQEPVVEELEQLTEEVVPAETGAAW